MWRWLSNNHQTLTGLGAMLVGIAALFIAWDQGRVMRAQQHAEVWPAVQIETSLTIADADGERVFLLQMTNDGIGPALINRIDAEFAGQALTNWEQLSERRPQSLPRPGMWTGSTQGAILAPGEVATLAALTWADLADQRDAMQEFQSDFFEITLEICYCSIYGRCWVARRTGRATHPEPVAACRAIDLESNL